jgi:hypothetical protein
MFAQDRWLDVNHVCGEVESDFDIFRRLDTSAAESLGSELHEPVVVHID